MIRKRVYKKGVFLVLLILVCTFILPLTNIEADVIYEWNKTTGANVTSTISFKDDAWIDDSAIIDEVLSWSWETSLPSGWGEEDITEVSLSPFGPAGGDYILAGKGTVSVVLEGTVSLDLQSIQFSWTQEYLGQVLTGTGVYTQETGNPPAVPEPATIALLGIGLAGLAGAEARRRRKKKAVDKS